jgi:hypothetical protein
VKDNIKDLEDYRLRKDGLVMDNLFLEIKYNCSNFTSGNSKTETIKNLHKLYNEMIEDMREANMNMDFVSGLELYLQYSFYNTTGQRILFIKNQEHSAIDIYDPKDSRFLGQIEPFSLEDDDTQSVIVIKVSSFKRIRLTFINQGDMENKIITMSAAIYSLLTQSKYFEDCIQTIAKLLSANPNIEIDI